jgi:hypothetical protein
MAKQRDITIPVILIICAISILFGAIKISHHVSSKNAELRDDLRAKYATEEEFLKECKYDAFTRSMQNGSSPADWSGPLEKMKAECDRLAKIADFPSSNATSP